MNLRTELTVSAGPWSLDIGDPVLTLGSCFAHSIGQRFFSHKFRAVVNPFGTTYHPLAIHRLLDYSIFKEYPAPHTYLTNQDTTYTYDLHSSFGGRSRENLELEVNNKINEVHDALKNCRVLILTYGTAWVYERKDTGEPVANCHRMHASLFTKRLTSTQEIVDSFRKTNEALLKINPGIKVILTLSPVRHLKDTIPMNSVSKSIVRVACHELSEALDQVDYFPAYELLMDDLRDYRFYKEDLIHPTPLAEQYIWEKFSTAYFSPSAMNFIKKWEAIQLSLLHRPVHPESKAYQQFLTKSLHQLEELRSVVDVEREIQELKLGLLHPSTTAP